MQFADFSKNISCKQVFSYCNAQRCNAFCHVFDSQCSILIDLKHAIKLQYNKFCGKEFYFPANVLYHNGRQNKGMLFNFIYFLFVCFLDKLSEIGCFSTAQLALSHVTLVCCSPGRTSNSAAT